MIKFYGRVYDYNVDCSDKVNPTITSLQTGKKYKYKELYEFYLRHIDEIELLQRYIIDDSTINLMTKIDKNNRDVILNAYERMNSEDVYKNFLVDMLISLKDEIINKYDEEIVFAYYFIREKPIYQICGKITRVSLPNFLK